jgi:hypothetical protein
MKQICYFISLLFISSVLFSCTTPRTGTVEKVELPKTVEVPVDGSTPIAGMTPVEKAKTVTFHGYGEKVNVKTGETVNFVYEGIDPDGSYLRYESTDEGYTLTLSKLTDYVTRLCQTFIVASPVTTTIALANEVRYEQIVWTPRADGTWEVRIGTTQRRCKSEALDRLNKLRTKDYEKRVQETKMK